MITQQIVALRTHQNLKLVSKTPKIRQALSQRRNLSVQSSTLMSCLTSRFQKRKSSCISRACLYSRKHRQWMTSASLMTQNLSSIECQVESSASSTAAPPRSLRFRFALTQRMRGSSLRRSRHSPAKASREDWRNQFTVIGSFSWFRLKDLRKMTCMMPLMHVIHVLLSSREPSAPIWRSIFRSWSMIPIWMTKRLFLACHPLRSI